jgi:dinuclear metal center YbgI/SA1388 family protein
MTIAEVIESIESVAPISLQEDWDNSGLLLGGDKAECSGVAVCLDVTADAIRQAADAGCNLLVSHHPVIFKGIKQVNSKTVAGAAIIEAIRRCVAVYCAHTSLDNAPEVGVSHEMARLLGAEEIQPMTASGTGVLARLAEPVSADEFAQRVKRAFSAEAVRCSVGSGRMIQRIVVGGGACGFLIPDAVGLQADAIVTADVRYHDFLDYGRDIFIADITHFDSEKCAKQILMRVISKKIANFAHCIECAEHNPISYK